MRHTSFAVAALGCLWAASAFAKPLYITVGRSFGTEEAPVVDVAFAESEPVELRVLKPDHLEAFLKEQADLRRAYQTPPTQVNPGRALSRGLNAVRSPGGYLRRALSQRGGRAGAAEGRQR